MEEDLRNDNYGVIAASAKPMTMGERISHAESAFLRDLDKMRNSHDIICVDKARIPKGSKLVECYETEDQFVIMGEPMEDDESHNCDSMGCTTLSHAVARVNKA